MSRHRHRAPNFDPSDQGQTKGFGAAAMILAVLAVGVVLLIKAF